MQARGVAAGSFVQYRLQFKLLLLDVLHDLFPLQRKHFIEYICVIYRVCDCHNNITGHHEAYRAAIGPKEEQLGLHVLPRGDLISLLLLHLLPRPVRVHLELGHLLHLPSLALGLGVDPLPAASQQALLPLHGEAARGG